MDNDWEVLQLATCKRFDVLPVPAPEDMKAGVSLTVKEGRQPVNGLRVPSTGDTTGWYFWAGEEWSDDPGFFVPLHVAHLASWCPQVLPYLQLPPGWRILIAPGYEDVWYDEQLLESKRCQDPI